MLVTRSSTGSGVTVYQFRDDGSGDTAPATPVSVQDGGSTITVTTGPLRFEVPKSGFTILDRVRLDLNQNGQYETSEEIISPDSRNGGIFVGRNGTESPDVNVQRDGEDLPAPIVEIEENGPVRAVIRAEMPARCVGRGNGPSGGNCGTEHRHGYAVRIYAYAGSPSLKIDYQLQNSPKNEAYGNPLYFEESRLDFRLNLANNPTVRVGMGDAGKNVYSRSAGNGLFLAQEFDDTFSIRDLANGNALDSGSRPDGFVDVSDNRWGVTAAIRNFWQMWPNGIEIDDSNKLSMQLFPGWSAQYHCNTSPDNTGCNDDGEDAGVSATGWYWLEDMQHVVKETLLHFHGAPAGNFDEEVVDVARTFQYYPVPVIPVSHYKDTGVTLDLDGLMLPGSRVDTWEGFDLGDQRQPLVCTSGNGLVDRKPDRYRDEGCDPNDNRYNFGWNYFYIDIKKRINNQAPNDHLKTEEHFIVSENPANYFVAEAKAMGELNVRPQWMAQYTHAADHGTIGWDNNTIPTGSTWKENTSDRGVFLAGSGPEGDPRDDQHGWYYHVEDAYYYTGNLWIKDWYRFIKEMRLPLLTLTSLHNKSSRENAHSMNHVLQAYRVIGDDGGNSYLNLIKSYMRNTQFGTQSPRCGQRYTVGNQNREQVFEAGYYMRMLINFMSEIQGPDGDAQTWAESFNMLSGMAEWNYNIGRFGDIFFNCQTNPGGDGNDPNESSNKSHVVPDPVAWYFWNTGQRRFIDQAIQYVEEGIPPGQGQLPNVTHIGNYDKYEGDYRGRVYELGARGSRADFNPPATINDLCYVPTGSNGVTLNWTPPVGATRYHVVWSDKPISATFTQSNSFSNWWAANAVGTEPQPLAGQLFINHSQSGDYEYRIFSFDNAGNMSGISNAARPASGPDDPNCQPVEIPLPAPPGNTRVQ